jgi:hypothetical protein
MPQNIQTDTEFFGIFFTNRQQSKPDLHRRIHAICNQQVRELMMRREGGETHLCGREPDEEEEEEEAAAAAKDETLHE